MTTVPGARPQHTADMDVATRLRHVQQIVLHLPEVGGLADIVANAPRLACEACDLDRAMVSHVRDGHIAVATSLNRRDPDRTETFRRLARTVRAELVDAPPELEAVTTQLPVLVHRLPEYESPVMQSVLETLEAREYIVAPIVHEAREPRLDDIARRAGDA